MMIRKPMDIVAPRFLLGSLQKMSYERLRRNGFQRVEADSKQVQRPDQLDCGGLGANLNGVGFWPSNSQRGSTF
jgi:hypothetical protein